MTAGQFIGPPHQAHRIQPLAIDRHRIAGFELNLHDLGLSRSGVHRDSHRVHLLRRLHVGILENTGLDAAAQQVEVDRIGRLLAHGRRNTAALAVGDRFLAAHPPLPGRGQHLEFGRQGTDGHIEAHLVVALAGAAMGHRIGTHLPGHLHQPPGDQRAGQGGGQRIATLVEGIGADGGEGELGDEGFNQVAHDRLAGAAVEGLAANRLELIALTEVGGEGDHLLHAPFLLEIGDADTGVDAAGIGQHHPAGPGGGAGAVGIGLGRRRHQCCSWGIASDCPSWPGAGRVQRPSSHRAMARGGSNSSVQMGPEAGVSESGQRRPAPTRAALSPRARNHSRPICRSLRARYGMALDGRKVDWLMRP